jgi:hypothetical protein
MSWNQSLRPVAVQRYYRAGLPNPDFPGLARFLCCGSDIVLRRAGTDQHAGERGRQRLPIFQLFRAQG